MAATFTAFIDGGARGNPGPAGWGAVIQSSDGETIAELCGGIPHATNNVAEYQGLIAALSWAVERRATTLNIKSDSLLVVQQMRGVFKVKHDGLKPLYGQAKLLAHKIGRVTYEHIPREKNKDADRLANQAMDEVARPID